MGDTSRGRIAGPHAPSPFTPIKRRGLACEVHLLAESHRRFIPTEIGYCSNQARWWFQSYALCAPHKRALERVLAQ